MVSLWTWICLDQANLHLSKELQILTMGYLSIKLEGQKELQWFREFMVVSSSQARFRKGATSASGAPGRKSSPRGSKSATFAQGLLRLFDP